MVFGTSLFVLPGLDELSLILKKNNTFLLRYLLKYQNILLKKENHVLNSVVGIVIENLAIVICPSLGEAGAKKV